MKAPELSLATASSRPHRDQPPQVDQQPEVLDIGLVVLMVGVVLPRRTG